MQSNIRKVSYAIPNNFVGKYLKDFLSSIGYSKFHLLSKNEKIEIDIVETEK